MLVFMVACLQQQNWINGDKFEIEVLCKLPLMWDNDNLDYLHTLSMWEYFLSISS